MFEKFKWLCRYTAHIVVNAKILQSENIEKIERADMLFPLFCWILLQKPGHVYNSCYNDQDTFLNPASKTETRL